MTTAGDVFLDRVLVGELILDAGGLVAFRFVDSYREMAVRPILGQFFEDDLDRAYIANEPGALPAFFANLLPEGVLRGILERTLAIGDPDDLSLLMALGEDLPGAVIVRPRRERADVLARVPPPTAPAEDVEGFRFSLAGAQLKFSMLASDDRLTLPAHGEHGDWIVKLSSPSFPRLVENEYATMEWARACGFDVPECRLYARDALEGIPAEHIPEGSTALAIRRFDRGPAGLRIHQEDFAQVMGRTRRRFSNGRYKYSSTMEALAVLVMSIAGLEGYTELIRRLAFVIASGNHDAHLKNWSLLYPDGRSATLSPLYDQVCTVAWPEHDRTMALKVAGTRNPGELDAARMEHLAKKVGADAAVTARIVEETIAAARGTFTTEMKPRLTTRHADALIEHWSRVPLLRSNGPLLA